MYFFSYSHLYIESSQIIRKNSKHPARKKKKKRNSKGHFWRRRTTLNVFHLTVPPFRVTSRAVFNNVPPTRRNESHESRNESTVAQQKESHRRHPVERTRGPPRVLRLHIRPRGPRRALSYDITPLCKKPRAPRRTRSRFPPGHRVSFTDGAPILVKQRNPRSSTGWPHGTVRPLDTTRRR